MNKKGAVPIIILILAIIGLYAFLKEDLPMFSDELKQNVCIPIEKNTKLCFLNETGVRLEGYFKNFQLKLNKQGINKVCYINSRNYNFEQVCKDEFGYLYQRNDFTLNILKEGVNIKTIASYQLYGLFWKVARNPKLTGKIAQNSAEAFAIRGIIYLAEHPEIFNKTTEEQ
jgi:hypothetical protein